MIVALTTAVAWADPRVRRDVPYADTSDERQTLDVYAPEGNGAGRPVVVWIHGGGWTKGSKAEMEAKPTTFVKAGCVFVPINYRLVPHATLQQMAADVAKAVRWVHQNTRDFGADPRSIFVMGHSAGAQLAALVCTDERYLKAEGLDFTLIRGCVPVDGGTYYAPLQIDTHLSQEASFRLKFPVGSERELSSVLYIARGKGIPPFLILHITDNPASGTALQARILAQVLEDAGVPVRLVGAPGKTHRSLNSDLGLPGDKPTQAIMEFVRQQMKSPR